MITEFLQVFYRHSLIIAFSVIIILVVYSVVLQYFVVVVLAGISTFLFFTVILRYELKLSELNNTQKKLDSYTEELRLSRVDQELPSPDSLENELKIISSRKGR